MPKKKYVVALSLEQREQLENLTHTGRTSAARLNHARILLKADVNQIGGGWCDQDISTALDVSISTIERVRRRFVENSLEAALSRQPPSRTKPRLLNEAQETRLAELAQSQTPEGRREWTVRLLASKMVELGYVERISHETVRQILKKLNITLVRNNAQQS